MVDYDEQTNGNNWGDHLGKFRGTADGIMDEIHVIRDQTAADLVSRRNTWLGHGAKSQHCT